MKTTLVAVALFAGGCAAPQVPTYQYRTQYQPMAFDGGYQDFQMGPGRFHVDVKGNSFTSKETVSGYFYRRSMDVCRAAGFDGFHIDTPDFQHETEKGGGQVLHTQAGGLRFFAASTTTVETVEGEKRYQVSADIVCTDPRQPSPQTP